MSTPAHKADAASASLGGKTVPGDDKKTKPAKVKLPASVNASDQEGASKSASASKSAKIPKKRKIAEVNAKKAPMKSSKTTDSAKKDKKVKKTEVKTKGPVDVERQCGVPLPQGGLCARSLTCKSHSMGSKRAVTGRSEPYDDLLRQYHKKNHAKLSMKAAAEQAASDMDDGMPPADSDEEVAAVMEAVARSTARTPSTKALMPVRRRHRFLRMREMVSTALRPGVQATHIQAHGKFIPFMLSRQNH